MPFFEIFPEFKKDVKRYNFVTHIEETCRKRPAGREKRKEGILFARTCALWNQKQKIKGSPNLYEKKS